MPSPIAEPFLSRVGKAHRRMGVKPVQPAGTTHSMSARANGWSCEARARRSPPGHLAAQPAGAGKYFSIARCFRYDQVDATHATDFFQVEGIVLGEDINFRTLLGLLNLFAREVAQAKEVKFLPAYFPFTEPSVELHVRHPKLGWMELGGRRAVPAGSHDSVRRDRAGDRLGLGARSHGDGGTWASMTFVNCSPTIWN